MSTVFAVNETTETLTTTIDEVKTEIKDKANEINEKIDKTNSGLNKKINKTRSNLTKKIKHDIDVVYLNMDKNNGKLKKLIDEEIEAIKENKDNLFVKPVRCHIKKVALFMWLVYLDDIYFGRYLFRFTAKRSAKEFIKYRRAHRECQYKNDLIVEETFYI